MDSGEEVWAGDRAEMSSSHWGQRDKKMWGFRTQRIGLSLITLWKDLEAVALAEGYRSPPGHPWHPLWIPKDLCSELAWRGRGKRVKATLGETSFEVLDEEARRRKERCMACCLKLALSDEIGRILLAEN